MPVPPVAVGPLLVASVRVADGPQPLRVRARAAGRALLAQLMRALGDTDARILSHCEVCGASDHGRPVAASGAVLLSIAYAGDRVAAAAAPAAAGRAVGIDVEVDRGAAALHELAPLFAPAAPPDVRGWTIVEAALKADGRGLRVPPHLVEPRTGEPGRLLPGSHRVAVPGRGARIEVAPAVAPDGFVISVAIDPGSE